jgi:hypothetical protein
MAGRYVRSIVSVLVIVDAIMEVRIGSIVPETLSGHAASRSGRAKSVDLLQFGWLTGFSFYGKSQSSFYLHFSLSVACERCNA